MASLTRAVIATAVLVVAHNTPAFAQQRGGARPTISRDAEIALARSAAPANVSGRARIWAWTGERYVVADSGRSPVNCYVGRPWDEALEPHCFDDEASRTIMPIMMRRVELYSAGRSEADVDRAIDRDIKSGKLRLPKRAAITYMMSSAQKLVNGEGKAVGAWQPHLMIYMPNLTEESAGLIGFTPGVGFVENPGKPLAALVVTVRAAVDPDSAARKP